MTSIRLGSISLDCAEPHDLATFWSRLLGGDIVYTSDDFVAVKIDHMWLSTLRVDNYQPPEWPDGSAPKQMHLDLGVDDLDQGELEALQLGARKAEHQPEPDRWRVYFDPAGHPFCLTTLIPE